MSIDKQTTEIKAVLEAVRKGLYEKDATAIGAQYASDAIIFDLSPPLGHLLDVPGLAAWLDTWEGPVKLVERDLKITVSGDLATCNGLQRVSATKADKQRVEWWQRITICLTLIDDAWKIAHEHTSVPFHMDGSFRPALDLEP